MAIVIRDDQTQIHTHNTNKMNAKYEMRWIFNWHELGKNLIAKWMSSPDIWWYMKGIGISKSDIYTFHLDKYTVGNCIVTLCLNACFSPHFSGHRLSGVGKLWKITVWNFAFEYSGASAFITVEVKCLASRHLSFTWMQLHSRLINLMNLVKMTQLKTLLCHWNGSRLRKYSGQIDVCLISINSTQNNYFLTNKVTCSAPQLSGMLMTSRTFQTLISINSFHNHN